jgi:beta-fructofuranosidase
MSLPRVVTGREDGSLHQAPAPEVDALRSELLYDGPAGEVGAADVGGDQLDIELDATLPPGASIDLAVRATADGAERTVYRLRRLGDQVEFSLDRSRSSLNDSVDAKPLAGVVALEGDTVRLRVVVDHSALEAFANGIPLAARAYPTRDDALRVFVDIDGAAATLRVWRVASVN